MLDTANILREAKDLGQQVLIEKTDTTFSWSCGVLNTLENKVTYLVV